MDFEKYYQHLKKLFKEFGYKESLKRKYLLHILYDEKEYLEVEKLKKLMMERYNEQISLSNIYKELKTLKNMQLVKSIEIQHKKMAYNLDLLSNKEYFICLNCHKIIELKNNEFAISAEKIAKEKGFQFIDYRLNLYGYCKECKDESDKN